MSREVAFYFFHFKVINLIVNLQFIKKILIQLCHRTLALLPFTIVLLPHVLNQYTHSSMKAYMLNRVRYGWKCAIYIS